MKKNRYREKGTGTIEKKSNHFYLKVRIRKRSKTTILRGKDDKPVTTRKDAEAAAILLRPVLRAQQKEEIALYIAQARKLRHEGSVPIEQIWKVYMQQYSRPDSGETTLESYKKILKHFSDWLGHEHPEIQRANQITKDEAGEFFSYVWNERKVSGRTFNSYRQALRLIFTHILTPAGLEVNPFSSVRCKPVNTESRQAFTEEQVKAIFDGFQNGFFYEADVEGFGPGRKRIRFKQTRQYAPMFKDEMRVLMMLCCWTGCRGQDGCLMQWSNVDLEHGTITYIPRKTARKTNNKAVSLPLHPDLATALKDALVFRDRNRKHEDYIIPSVAERYLRNHSGVQDDVQKIIHCATGLAISADECPEHRVRRPNRYSLHSFRHTFVSFCANAGVPLDVVASIVGHSSTVTTRHYAHISDEAKLKAISVLPSVTTTVKEVPDNRQKLMEKLNTLSDEQLSALLDKIG